MTNNYTDQELIELAYALQIPYDYNNLDRENILIEIDKLKERASVLNNIEERQKWENEVKERNLKSREATPCHDTVTVITGKETALMSNNQIAFMEDKLPNGKVIYYCLDKVDDVKVALEARRNPFTNTPLTNEQLAFLQEVYDDPSFPKLSVGEYFDEIEEKLLGQTLTYTEPAYKEPMRRLHDKVADTGYTFIAVQIFYFSSELTSSDYALFLQDRKFSKVIDENLLRDDAAYETLSYILDYVEKIKNEKGLLESTQVTIEIGKAIDEFNYMIKNNLNYGELIKEKGQILKGKVSELYWKPWAVREIRYPDGGIRLRWYIKGGGKKEGPYIEYSRNGYIVSQDTYKDGILDGISYLYYPGGEVRREIKYINGEDISTELFYQNGQLSCRYIYNENNNYLGLNEIWDESGNFMGIRYISVKKYKDTGVLSVVFFVDDKGTPDGPIDTFYDNGEHRSTGFMKNNSRNGHWEYWHKNGIHGMVGRYKNNKNDGLWKTWYSNGQQESEGSYDNGAKKGLWKTWYNNGQQESEGSYTNNNKIGTWFEWRQNGEYCETIYLDNEIFSKNCWNDNGDLIESSLENLMMDFGGGTKGATMNMR